MASSPPPSSKNNDPLAIDSIFKVSPKELRAVTARRALSSHFGRFRKHALYRASNNFNVNNREKKLLEHVVNCYEQQENISNAQQQNMRLLVPKPGTHQPTSKTTVHAGQAISQNIFEACEQGSLQVVENFACPRPTTPVHETSTFPGGRLEARIRAHKAKLEPEGPQGGNKEPLRWAFARDSCGQTVLHVAARCSHAHIVEWLIQHVSDKTCATDKSEVLSKLLNARTSVHNGDTPLILAAKSRCGEPSHRALVIHSLIKAGADMTAQNAGGDTMLHEMVRHPMELQPVKQLLRQTNRGLVILNTRNMKGHTALDLINIQINRHAAGGSSHMHAVKDELVAAGNSTFRRRLQIKQHQYEQDERQTCADTMESLLYLRAKAKMEAAEASAMESESARRRSSAATSIGSRSSGRSARSGSPKGPRPLPRWRSKASGIGDEECNEKETNKDKNRITNVNVPGANNDSLARNSRTRTGRRQTTSRRANRK